MTPDDRLDFLLSSDTPEAARRRQWTRVASVLLHAVLIVSLPFLPSGASTSALDGPRLQIDFSRATPLVAPKLPPPPKLTQVDPNRGKVGTELSMADLMPKPPVQQQRDRGEAPRPLPPAPGPLPAPKPMEAPKVETSAVDVSQLKGPLAAGIPQIQPVEKPKLAFESVGSSMGQAPSGSLGASRIEAPKSGIDAATRAVTRAGRGGLIVGDVPDGAGGIDLPGQIARPGASGSSLELLSDPLGIDFKPYLVQVLAAVRRNWFAVMPESARMGGRRGRTILQFSISRDGHVPKLVIADASGTEAFDRAAVAGVSASNPFPPLPTNFKGQEVRLQFVFSYNMPAK